jgi:hypothetical protein
LTIRELEILYYDIQGRTDEYGSDEEDRLLMEKLKRIIDSKKDN